MPTALAFPSETELIDEICNRRINYVIFFESGQQFLLLILLYLQEKLCGREQIWRHDFVKINHACY
jgi:hypothetical protein